MSFIIEVEKLVKKYKELVAVKGINFKVEKGEIFGFLGPNGAGKSTTIKMLATLLKPTSGGARINGFDIVKQQDKVRQSIGLVFQDPSLDERLTAQENLNFHALLYNVDRQVFAGRIAEVLKMVELEGYRHSLVKTFSGGMKRRLEIARGLIHYPQLLFLDEPTLGLDPQTRKRIWEYVHELRQRGGITIFMTTHYMDEAENCDRIAIIDHGEIVALNTPENLKRMVGGDIVTVVATDPEKAKADISSRFGLEVTEHSRGLQMEVEQGETFIPVLAGELQETIKSVTLHKPTLDDVFLKLTGREIREEIGSRLDTMRVYARRRR